MYQHAFNKEMTQETLSMRRTIDALSAGTGGMVNCMCSMKITKHVCDQLTCIQYERFHTWTIIYDMNIR